MEDEDKDDDAQIEAQSGRSNAYICTYPGCGKNYSRASHLARHRQTHQDIKHHHCDVCGKSFMRQDVLVRHRKRQHPAKDASTLSAQDELEYEDDSESDARHIQAAVVAPVDKNTASQSLAVAKDTLSQFDIRQILHTSTHEPISSSRANDSTASSNFVGHSSLPTSSGIVLPNVNYAWQGNSLDLDSLLFSAPPVSGNTFTPAQTAASDDFNPIFASWAIPTQPTSSANNNLISSSTLPWTGHDNPNDDFLRWLNGDIGIPDAPQVDPYQGVVQTTSQPDASAIANVDTLGAQSGVSPAAGGKAIPSLQHGLRTRPPSPVAPSDADNESQWPMSWEPNRQEHDAGLSSNIIDFGEVQVATLSSAPEALVIPMDESCRLAILELLHFAEIPANAYHRLYVRLSKIPLSALNSFLSVYFQEIHPYMPFLHKVSFDPRKNSGFLLTIMVAIGAQLSNLPGTRSLSHFLGDLVHSAFSKVVDADRILARELKMMQTLIIWSLLRYNGLRRLMEMAEVFRAPYAVSLGRLHAFDGKIKLPTEVDDVTVPLDRRWRVWRTWEARRRTGLASFLSEAEFTVLLNRPPMIVPREIRGHLPCSDDIWDATTAEEWHQLYQIERINSSGSYPMSDVVDCRPVVLRDMARHTKSTAFGTTCIVQMLHVNIWTVRQCGSSNSPFVRTMLQEIQRALIMVACSDNEFTPFQRDSTPAWRSVAILYHFAQIASRIPVPTLLALAGKESSQEAEAAAASLKEWLASSPVSGREVAMHAGQCWRLLHLGTLRGTFEPFCFLYSTLVLYTCALTPLIARSDELGMPSIDLKSDEDYISLDCSKPGAIELNFVQTGLAAVKLGDIRLGSSAAGQEILARAWQFMERNNAWGLTAGLGNLLQEVRNRATDS